MYYAFKDAPNQIKDDTIVAVATNGVVYVENNRLHISTSMWHLIYKWDGSPIGWYVRNTKTNDDIYLGINASPSAELETLEIKDNDAWNEIVYFPNNEENKEE